MILDDTFNYCYYYFRYVPFCLLFLFTISALVNLLLGLSPMRMRKDPVKMTKNNSFADCAIDLPRDGISDDCEFDRDDFIDFLLRLSFVFDEST